MRAAYLSIFALFVMASAAVMPTEDANPPAVEGKRMFCPPTETCI
ncbi:hypothetical protein D9619_003922 [Psilocybe cf. subviscida]|uniref:Uncharacterized protein n=1 Tax=Psilocybe cf. subviscida TaxID=2480587 RepID=A0A8H5F8F1_9AGAR|nr:hypothetical protein D9619_003922 [Psilocybe cf. subviscida]